MIKLLLTNDKGTADITQLVSVITLSGDYQQCARTLTLGILASPTDSNVPAVACELGNGIALMEGEKVLFSGFIFTRQKSTSGNTIDVTCFDRGIYLKRNEAVYKFLNMTPESIAKRVCTDFKIETGSIASTGIKVSRNFIGTNLYSMIQTAYTLASNTTGKKYQMRFNGAKLDVIEKRITSETPIISGGNNLMALSTTESVENMVNQVVIRDSRNKPVKTLNDSEAIKLYGLMQSYLRQSDKKDATAEANKLLKDNGVSQKITVENLGDPAYLTGESIVIQEPYTGVYGLFYIDSDVHTWRNGQYFNKLVVNFQNIMDEKDVGELANGKGA